MTSPEPEMPYDVVLIVYNPHSTGGAEHRARDLATELADRAPDLEVTLAPTEYPGHATEIAREAAGGRAADARRVGLR